MVFICRKITQAGLPDWVTGAINRCLMLKAGGVMPPPANLHHSVRAKM